MADEMTIPKPGEIGVFAPLAIVVAASFTALAIVNIHHHESPVASGIWLAIVGIVALGGLTAAGGLRGAALHALAAYAQRHFARIIATEAGGQSAAFGFEWRSRPFILKRIAIDRIATVEWITGQATSLAGRDMGDWHVVVWFDGMDPAKLRATRSRRLPSQSLMIVGPPGPRAKTEAFGLELVAFLRGAGARLVRAGEPNVFVREGHAA